MSKPDHQVHVLHKCETIAASKESGKMVGTLAVGRTFRFPKSGDAYTVQESGAVVNVQPKPYRNKAERKNLKARRRQERLENREP